MLGFPAAFRRPGFCTDHGRDFVVGCLRFLIFLQRDVLHVSSDRLGVEGRVCSLLEPYKPAKP